MCRREVTRIDQKVLLTVLVALITSIIPKVYNVRGDYASSGLSKFIYIYLGFLNHQVDIQGDTGYFTQ